MLPENELLLAQMRRTSKLNLRETTVRQHVRKGHIVRTHQRTLAALINALTSMKVGETKRVGGMPWTVTRTTRGWETNDDVGMFEPDARSLAKTIKGILDNEDADVGRGPSGKLRNIKAMNSDKLTIEYSSLLREQGRIPDPEAVAAFETEMRRRGFTLADIESYRDRYLPKPAASKTARGPTGRLRNIKAMTDEKLRQLAAQIAKESNDDEAMSAIAKELNRRTDAGKSAEATKPLSKLRAGDRFRYQGHEYIRNRGSSGGQILATGISAGSKKFEFLPKSAMVEVTDTSGGMSAARIKRDGELTPKQDAALSGPQKGDIVKVDGRRGAITGMTRDGKSAYVRFDEGGAGKFAVMKLEPAGPGSAIAEAETVAATTLQPAKRGDMNVPIALIPVGSQVVYAGENYAGVKDRYGQGRPRAVGTPVEIGPNEYSFRYHDGVQWDYVDGNSRFDVIEVPSGKNIPGATKRMIKAGNLNAEELAAGDPHKPEPLGSPTLGEVRIAETKRALIAEAEALEAKAERMAEAGQDMQAGQVAINAMKLRVQAANMNSDSDERDEDYLTILQRMAEAEMPEAMGNPDAYYRARELYDQFEQAHSTGDIVGMNKALKQFEQELIGAMEDMGDDDFREHEGFKVTQLPPDRRLSPDAARRRQKPGAATRSRFTPRSVTKPHQHHLLTKASDADEGGAVSKGSQVEVAGRGTGEVTGATRDGSHVYVRFGKGAGKFPIADVTSGGQPITVTPSRGGGGGGGGGPRRRSPGKLAGEPLKLRPWKAPTGEAPPVPRRGGRPSPGKLDAAEMQARVDAFGAALVELGFKKDANHWVKDEDYGNTWRYRVIRYKNGEVDIYFEEKTASANGRFAYGPWRLKDPSEIAFFLDENGAFRFGQERETVQDRLNEVRDEIAERGGYTVKPPSGTEQFVPAYSPKAPAGSAKRVKLQTSKAERSKDRGVLTLKELEAGLKAKKDLFERAVRAGDMATARAYDQEIRAILEQIELAKPERAALRKKQGERARKGRKVGKTQYGRLSQMEIIDRQIDSRLALLLSAKDVGPDARRKLRGILKHYAKKKHPFAACVRDNRKRFGPGTEAVCATLKDIIRGSTKWRKGGKHDKGAAGLRGLSFDADIVELLLSIPDDELAMIYANELHLEEVTEEAEDEFPEEANYRRAEDEKACGTCANFDADEGFCMFYGAPTEADMLSDRWSAVGEELEDEAELSQLVALSSPVPHAEDSVVLGQFFLPGEGLALSDEEDDGKGIWKTVLRTGTWKTRPGPGGKVLTKPLHVVHDGPVRKGQVSLKALVDAFEDGAVEHVTIPLSHQDRVDENTGTIKKLRIVEDESGARLEALHEFSEPDIEKKVRNRSILNTSCGILFDYIRKRDGKRYSQALGHIALTNKPWIDGMEPFGQTLAASEQNLEAAIGLEMTDDTHVGGEQEVELTDHEVEQVLDLSERLGLSLEEIEERLTRADELETAERARAVEDRAKAWADEGVPPAVAEAAREFMLADDGGPALMLSEDNGKTKTLTATDVVEAIVAKVPRLDLSDRGPAAKDNTDDRPADDASDERSHEEKVAEAEAFLEGKEAPAVTT